MMEAFTSQLCKQDLMGSLLCLCTAYLAMLTDRKADSAVALLSTYVRSPCFVIILPNVNIQQTIQVL